MSIFVNREGSLSIVRIGGAIAVIGVLVIVAGFVLFQIEQQRFKSPLDVDVYPNARNWRTSEDTGTFRRVWYYAEGIPADEVFAFYEQEIDSYYDGDENEDCERYPRIGEFSDYEPGGDTVPYYYACMFNDSQYNNNRYTLVRILPGVFDPETGNDYDGDTFIEYEQSWQR